MTTVESRGAFFRPIPYMGSFQRGPILRSGGDALGFVWRHIERVSTIDSLARIATRKGQDPALAKVACLRARQAVELRRASRGATMLTRPLLLYYSALNLVRAMMLVHTGTIGGTSHGLQSRTGASLLTCGARVMGSGTFPAFAASVGTPPETENATLTLRDVFAVIPEVYGDFRLLGAGTSSIVPVRVRAMMQGDMTLHFGVIGVSEEDFRARWAELFPWLKDECVPLPERYSLGLKKRPQNEDEIRAFCEKFLIVDLLRREDAVWYDQIAGGNVVLLKRLPAYIAALFILSSICRYQPELLEEPAREQTDLGYFLNAFLDAAERFLPHLVMELVTGGPLFFE